MTEKEIRDVIQSVCAELDQRVRQIVSGSVRKVVLPAALGAGLALSTGACSDDGRQVPTGDAQTEAGLTSDGAVYAAPDAGPQPAYMAPADMGPQPPYQAPDPPDAGPQPPYMAPDAAIYAAPDAMVDTGPVPPYMAPDMGPQPDYMAPDGGELYAAPPIDAGLDAPPLPPYMAPGPDGGPQPDYMAPDPDGSTD